MKDLFRNYHKHKVLSHLGIVWISLFFAISFNMLIAWNQSANLLKANVLEATQQTQKADIEILKSSDSLVIVTNQEMRDLTELSFSLVYDPETITLWTAKNKIEGMNISEIENEDGYKSLIFTFDSPTNISISSPLLSISVESTSETTNYINIISANFTDKSGQTYILTSSGIIF